jgi:hypothetical protein
LNRIDCLLPSSVATLRLRSRRRVAMCSGAAAFDAGVEVVSGARKRNAIIRPAVHGTIGLLVAVETDAAQRDRPLNALLPDRGPNRVAVPLQFSNCPDVDLQNTRVVGIDVRHSFSVSHARVFTLTGRWQIHLRGWRRPQLRHPCFSNAVGRNAGLRQLFGDLAFRPQGLGRRSRSGPRTPQTRE